MKKILTISILSIITIGSFLILFDKEKDTLTEIKGREVRDVVEDFENGVYTDVDAAAFSTHIEVYKDNEVVKLYDKEDMFYVSIAPYVNLTHAWGIHSLTGCRGELQSAPIDVKIVNRTTGEVLVDQEITTYKNGFMGFWLPRDIEVSIEMSYENTSGSYYFTTYDSSPTCLTEFKLY